MLPTNDLTLADLVTQLRDANHRAATVSHDFEQTLVLLDTVALRLRELVRSTEDVVIYAACLEPTP